MQQEKVIETKVCKLCSASFDITDKDLEFLDKLSPIIGGKKIYLPTQTLCQNCREQRRLAHRNERKLFKRVSDATWKNIISIYSPDKTYKVYEHEEWWSDRWDPMDYGMDFDADKSLFEQLGVLFKTVPRIWLLNKNTENSDFNNYIEDAKNCYMTFRSYYGCENIYYSYRILSNSKDIVDGYNLHNCENSYELIDSKNCFGSIFLLNSADCSHCVFWYNLTNCKNCLMCSNLSGKEYCIENQQYSKEDYLKKRKAIGLWNFEQFTKLKETFLKNLQKTIRRNLSMFNCENSAWDALFNSKNCYNCYNCTDCEDMKNVIDSFWMKDVYDVTGIWGWEKSYETNNANRASNLYFSNYCYNVNHVYYSDTCHFSENLFACIGLRNASYCILNKQYTKEEYEALVPKIIEHMMTPPRSSTTPPEGNYPEWWEFFPSSLSPFWYNETVASEYFPLSKEEALKRWFKWSDYEAPFPKVEKIIPANKLPDDISKIPDDILNWAIECEVTGKPFRIIKQELKFYRKHDLPIPRRHPDQRHIDRMKLRNPRKLFERKCDKCWKEIITTYAPERPEIVYCEECYNKELVG